MNKIEDPSQPSMELRVLLAVVLSLLVMLGYQYFLPTPQAPPPPLSTTAPFESPIETEDLQSSERPGLSGDIVPSTLPETQASPTRIRMINPSMELLWTNQRGRLLSAQILRYRDDDGEPVEVIPQEIPDDATRPLELLIEGFEAALSQGVYDVEIDSGGTRVVPFDARLLYEVFLPAKDLMGAAAGDMVLVELTRFPTPHRAPMGRIIQVLGNVDEPGVDVRVVLAKHGIPEVFPEDVLAEAESVEDELGDDALEGREDFRERPIVTIDGETARDFDDAV